MCVKIFLMLHQVLFKKKEKVGNPRKNNTFNSVLAGIHNFLWRNVVCRVGKCLTSDSSVIIFRSKQ